jgi:hypothetical protein
MTARTVDDLVARLGRGRELLDAVLVELRAGWTLDEYTAAQVVARCAQSILDDLRNDLERTREETKVDA